MYRLTVAMCLLTLLLGCASTQLTYNTLDVGGSIESIYRRQTLLNLSKTIDDNWALPSQFEIAAGTVQTSNSVTPNVTFPVSTAVARNGSAVVTSLTRAGAGMTVAANDGWQQSWTVAPVTETVQLRQLRAIYRKVLGKDDPEYKRALQKFYPHAREGWIYWTSEPGSPVGERLPEDGSPTVDLGQYGNHHLLVKVSDYKAGNIQELILAVMAVNDSGSTSVAGKKKGTSGGGGGKKFNLIIPQQIQPQIQ